MKITPEQAVEMYDARSNGLSFNQIAKDMGLNRSVVQKEVRNLEQLYGPALKEEDMPEAIRAAQQDKVCRKRWKFSELNRLIQTMNKLHPPGTGGSVPWKEIQKEGGFMETRGLVALRKKWEYTLAQDEIVIKNGQYAIADMVEEMPDVFEVIDKKEPQQMTIPFRKRSVIKKSFLWGLYTVVREE
jgi:hypothetical protein